MSPTPPRRTPFVDEDSGPEEEGSSPPEDPYTHIRATKAQLQANTPLLQPTAAKAPKSNSNANIKTESKPHPILANNANETTAIEEGWIKQLRSPHPDGDKESWSKIAEFLNHAREGRPEPAHLTPQAVYAAYVRTTSEAVAPANELGFAAEDYVHLRNAVNTSKGKATVKTKGHEIRHNVREATDDTSMLGTVKGAEALVEAVARVERGFWGYVADEMERSTGRLYKTEDLAARFHEI